DRPIDSMGRSAFWPPFDRTHVIDPQQLALWIHGALPDGVTAPDLGPFVSADVVVGIPGEAVPHDVLTTTWRVFLELRWMDGEPIRPVVHGPELSEATELLGGAKAEPLEGGVTFVWAADLAGDVVAAHREAAARYGVVGLRKWALAADEVVVYV